MQRPMDERQQKIARARTYFICAIAVLFVFALLWSVDSAIAYILFGIFGLFLVLGLITWPWQIPSSFKKPHSYSPPQSASKPQAQPAKTFESLLEEILDKAKKED